MRIQVVPIEVKYKEKGGARPVWNSGLPRPSGIYIFGSYVEQQITFFLGRDLVTDDEARAMHEFFDVELKAREREFNQEHLASHVYGFSVYVRKAFDQGKQYNDAAVVDFFANPERERLEANVISAVP